MVLYFGRNIIATEGEEWKKHRKIANPAFSEVCSFVTVPPSSHCTLHPCIYVFAHVLVLVADVDLFQPNNKLVWREAVRITMDMVDNVWKNAETMEFDHVVDVTLPVRPQSRPFSFCFAGLVS